MATIRAEEVRIPRKAREALARREAVVVFNRDRPVYVILNPEDSPATAGRERRGRSVGEALAILRNAAPPDPDFAKDLQDILASVGPTPPDPWAPS